MPDFITMYARVCATNLHWQKEVEGSGNTYTVRFGFMPYPHETQYDWSCTCPAYKRGRGKYCKHIEKVREAKERCGWNAELEPTAQANPDDTCPCCGGPTEVIPVGV
jgi:hypothetical protein